MSTKDDTNMPFSTRNNSGTGSPAAVLTTSARRDEPRRHFPTANQRESLLFSLPFMVFLFFPIFATVQLGVTSWQGAFLLVCILGLATSYIASWLVTEVSSAGNSNRAFYICIAIMLASQLGMFTLGLASIQTGSQDIITGAPYMLMYPTASWIFLAPGHRIVPGAIAIWVLVLAQTLVDQLAGIPSSELFAIAIVALGSVVNFASRRNLNLSALKKMEQAQEVELSRERERTQIAADLHDVLGQTLTAISMKTDLASRLLQADQVNQARVQLNEVAELSRLALADVRRVVAQSRVLVPADELVTAEKLLKTIGCPLHILRTGTPPPGAPSTLVAHVIREATTNALRHAQPTLVTVQLRADGVRVTNNSVRASKRRKAFSKAFAESHRVEESSSQAVATFDSAASAPTSTAAFVPSSTDTGHPTTSFAPHQTATKACTAPDLAGSRYADNGERRNDNRRYSTGLEGLRARAAEWGEVTWGFNDLGEWVVNLTLGGSGNESAH